MICSLSPIIYKVYIHPNGGQFLAGFLVASSSLCRSTGFNSNQGSMGEGASGSIYGFILVVVLSSPKHHFLVMNFEMLLNHDLKSILRPVYFCLCFLFNTSLVYSVYTVYIPFDSFVLVFTVVQFKPPGLQGSFLGGCVHKKPHRTQQERPNCWRAKAGDGVDW